MAREAGHQERLRNAGLAPEAKRPRWTKRPDPHEAIIAVIVIIAGATGLVVTETKDPPILLVVVFWVLTLVPIMSAIAWVAWYGWQEVRVAVRRIRWYGQLHDDYVRQVQRLEVAGRALVSIQQIPGRFQVANYRLSGAVMRNGDACLTIIESDGPTIPANEILTVYDSVDNVWFAYIEATEERLMDGQLVAQIVDADQLFLGHIHQTAMQRRPLETRGRVIRMIPRDQEE